MFAVAEKTTWQIRTAAKELMEQLGRPVSVSEIKSFIEAEKKELSAKVNEKSIDYVRVTLTTTPGGVFVKYLCPREFELSCGESSKKLFWGLSGGVYEGMWRVSEEGVSSKSKSESGSRSRSKSKVVSLSDDSYVRVRQSEVSLSMRGSRADASVQVSPASIDEAYEAEKSLKSCRLVEVCERVTEPEYEGLYESVREGVEMFEILDWCPMWSEKGEYEYGWW
jgi:hypothetical protein